MNTHRKSHGIKKLLVVMLVLATNSLASASLQISVNGNPEPLDPEYIITPSETLVLGIWTDMAIAPGGEGECLWALTANTGCATISGGLYVGGGDVFADIMDDAVGNGIGGIPQGENGPWGFLFVGSGPIPANTVLFDQIILHCEADNGPTTVTLWCDSDWDFFMDTAWDQVVIHQIPEPITITLLGLGSLALIRRRRK